MKNSEQTKNIQWRMLCFFNPSSGWRIIQLQYLKTKGFSLFVFKIGKWSYGYTLLESERLLGHKKLNNQAEIIMYFDLVSLTVIKSGTQSS